MTNVQPLVKTPEATSKKVDTIERNKVETQVTTKEQQETSQIESFAPTTQDQGALQVIMDGNGKPKSLHL